MQSLANDDISWKGPTEWGELVLYNLHKPRTLGGFCTKHQTRPSNALILIKEHQGREDLVGKSPFVEAGSVPKSRMPQSWPFPSMEKVKEAERKVPEELMVRVHMLPSLQSSTKAEAMEDFRTPEMVQLHKAIQEGKQQGALGRTFATRGVSGKKAQSIMKRAFQHCCLSHSQSRVVLSSGYH